MSIKRNIKRAIDSMFSEADWNHIRFPIPENVKPIPLIRPAWEMDPICIVLALTLTDSKPQTKKVSL